MPRAAVPAAGARCGAAGSASAAAVVTPEHAAVLAAGARCGAAGSAAAPATGALRP